MDFVFMSLAPTKMYKSMYKAFQLKITSEFHASIHNVYDMNIDKLRNPIF